MSEGANKGACIYGKQVALSSPFTKSNRVAFVLPCFSLALFLCCGCALKGCARATSNESSPQSFSAQQAANADGNLSQAGCFGLKLTLFVLGTSCCCCCCRFCLCTLAAAAAVSLSLSLSLCYYQAKHVQLAQCSAVSSRSLRDQPVVVVVVFSLSVSILLSSPARFSNASSQRARDRGR